MAALTNLDTLAVDFLAPPRATWDVVGSSISGGRNAQGETQTIEMSGGGLLTATYEDIKVKDPEQFEYINYLGAYLNGGFRYMNVPIVTDWYGPFPRINKLPTPIVKGNPHSDGSLFSDGAGYSQATVWGEVTEAASLNAGVLKMRVYGLSRALRWSDWFSIYHPTKGWRAYRYWRVLDATQETNPVYTLALSPPLREAVSAGDRIEFARPRFVAKFKDGFTLPSTVEAFYVTQATLQFSEAF